MSDAVTWSLEFMLLFFANHNTLCSTHQHFEFHFISFHCYCFSLDSFFFPKFSAIFQCNCWRVRTYRYCLRLFCVFLAFLFCRFRTCKKNDINLNLTTLIHRLGFDAFWVAFKSGPWSGYYNNRKKRKGAFTRHFLSNVRSSVSVNDSI